MNQDIHYLRSSIFCSPDSWPKLLKEGLQPFIKRHSTINCIFSINNEHGSNIRLIIGVNASELKMVAIELHQHLRRFFKDQLPSSLAQPTRQSLFMDFPENSVRYNLFNHSPYMIEFPNKVINIDNFRADFWKLIVNMDIAAIKEIVDNRFAFSLKIFLTSLYCFSDNAKHARSIAVYVLKQISDNDSSSTQTIEKEYAKYQSGLLSIIGETWKALESNEEHNHFFLQFKKLFKELASTVKTLRPSENRFVVFYESVATINIDLGFEDQAMTIYLLKRSIEFLNKRINMDLLSVS